MSRVAKAPENKPAVSSKTATVDSVSKDLDRQLNITVTGTSAAPSPKPSPVPAPSPASPPPLPQLLHVPHRISPCLFKDFEPGRVLGTGR